MPWNQKMGLKRAELNPTLVEFRRQIGDVHAATQIVHIGHELIAAANRGGNHHRQRLPDSRQIAGEIDPVAVRADGRAQAAESGGALAGNAFGAQILDVPRPEVRIQAFHVRSRAAVLPPERHALVEVGLVQQIHEQGRVFLVRDVVGDLLGVLRHSHGLANRLEVRVADARQGFIMLVDRHLDAALLHPRQKSLQVGHLLEVAIVARPNHLRRRERIQHDHIDRKPLFAKAIDDHLPLLIRIVRPRAEPQAEHIARQHGNRPDELGHLLQLRRQNRCRTRRSTSRGYPSPAAASPNPSLCRTVRCGCRRANSSRCGSRGRARSPRPCCGRPSCRARRPGSWRPDRPASRHVRPTCRSTRFAGCLWRRAPSRACKKRPSSRSKGSANRPFPRFWEQLPRNRIAPRQPRSLHPQNWTSASIPSAPGWARAPENAHCR